VSTEATMSPRAALSAPATVELRQPGRVVAGRFVVETIAGQGGLGTVYRAHDRAGDRTVAIKLLRAGDAPDRRRFEREAGVLASLSHPAIVPYVAHGYDEDGTPYLAMAWLDGETLGQSGGADGVLRADGGAGGGEIGGGRRGGDERGLGGGGVGRA
jgi:hypothetical protein